MNWIGEHALGLIIIVLLAYSIYQKKILLEQIKELLEQKVEKPLKEEIKIQYQVQEKMDDALSMRDEL